MGSAAGSLDTCEEKLALCEAWHEATQDERHEMGLKIGKEMSRLMKSERKTAADVRADLAEFVRREILGRRGRSRGRGRSGRNQNR
jgi:hypothetical protein